MKLLTDPNIQLVQACDCGTTGHKLESSAYRECKDQRSPSANRDHPMICDIKDPLVLKSSMVFGIPSHRLRPSNTVVPGSTGIRLTLWSFMALSAYMKWPLRGPAELEARPLGGQSDLTSKSD